MRRADAAATLSDIARKLGICPSTVNKILNGIQGPVFRPETKKAVLEEAARLGYVPPRRGKKRMMEAVRGLLAASSMALVELREGRMKIAQSVLETAIARYRDMLS